MLSTPKEAEAVHRSPTRSQRAVRGRYRLDRQLAVLDAIAQPTVSIAVYRRPLPEMMLGELSCWAREHDPSYDEVVQPEAWDVASAMAQLTHAGARSWLEADVTQLLARFVALAETPRVRIALRAVQTDACRKFHVDFVHMRLITTYVGPGTEWLPHHAARREVLEHPPDCPCDANQAIVRARRAVRHARTGDVLLMKGERHGHGAGTVHRSPPIEAAGATRLVLTLTSVHDR